MSALPTVRGFLIVTAVVVSVGAAGAFALVLNEEKTPASASASASTPAVELKDETPRLEAIEPVRRFGQGGPGVTVTPPRLLAIAPATVPKKTRYALSRLKHVQKVIVVDAGSVKVAGTAVNLLAVEPAEYRSWTPQAVADQPEVWSALARGELVADTTAVRRFGMVLGASYQVDGGPRLRVAASATLGLPGVDGIVSAEVGRSLGLMQGVAVLLHGKEGKIREAAVRKLLGRQVQVLPVGADAVAPQPVAGNQQAGNQQAGSPQADKQVVRQGSYLELYKAAATRCPGLSWTVLAAIGQVESSHGRNNGPSSAGALGPMQFMPATWKAYGVDGDGDGIKDIWSPYDAVPGAANYLCANGAGQGGQKLRKAVWFYNHSWAYVNKVLGLSEAYARTYA
ncbi:lytic transglycosylase domain-containing protein [Nonomuraea dietziae]|uniref:lytic transglycosylase domain-containing protein n=1 Tax=Nonomuraea dietziae TaxID=65515 RepID=UPI003441CAEF